MIQFDFDPNLSLKFDSSPLALGSTKFGLTAEAALKATATFNIGGIGSGSFDIVDALGLVTANRCDANDTPSHLEIFGIDFFPQSLLFDTNTKSDLVPVAFDETQCNSALDAFETTVDRAKKALKDAEALLTQYNANKAAGAVFGYAGAAADAGITNLCEQIAASAPENFPPGNCATETPEATINRFIGYYSNQIQAALSTQENLAASELKYTNTIPLTIAMGSDQQTLFEATFFIGPIPCLLQVQSVENYGIMGDLTFLLQPGAIFNATSRSTIAKLTGGVTPQASAGVSLFVGVGFDIGIASASAGVEGEVTLGAISAPITASAGLDIAPAQDTRPLPSDLAPLAGGTPFVQPTQYEFLLDYGYGAAIDINQILAGYLAARLEVSFLFWSASWTATIVNFGNGFSLPQINLISGDGTTPAGGSFPWATVQMPTPFVALAPLSVPSTPTTTVPDGGPAKVVNFDTSQVEKLFYNSLCTCVPEGLSPDGGSTCFRNADCCEPDGGTDAGDGGVPPIVCFSDPAMNGVKTCENCRMPEQSIPVACPPTDAAILIPCTTTIPAQSCNQTSDCCQEAPVLPDGGAGTQCIAATCQNQIIAPPPPQ